MKAQKKVQSACDISIYADKGSLALRFPKRHNALWEQLDGKSLNGKPKCLGIGKFGYKNTPEDWKRATQLAIALESDLDHPEWEKLFDPTLAKYGLGGGKYAKLADVLQMPGTRQPEPETTVGEMWEDYLIWKEIQVEPSTFHDTYKRTYTNILKGLKWNNKTKSFENVGSGIWDLIVSAYSADILSQAPFAKKNKVFPALNEAFNHAQQLGKFNLPSINPFLDSQKKIEDSAKEKYKSTVGDDGEVIEWWQAQDTNEDELERDRRSFTKEERDIIIKAFYESDRVNMQAVAPLIEFLFLTGCRPGEAFALRWQDIMFSREVIRFSKSYAGSVKRIQRTKTKTIRLFPLVEQRLIKLLTRIKPLNGQPTDLVFVQVEGQIYNSRQLSYTWLGEPQKSHNFLGVVSQLVVDKKIGGYLSPYHTRHTYITLTAHANKDNSSALLLLAHACGNSTEVILKHYLDVDRTVKLISV